jgi:hypothetical protein
MNTIVNSSKNFSSHFLIRILEQKVIEGLVSRNGIAVIDELGLLEFWYEKPLPDCLLKTEVLEFFGNQGGYIAHVVTNLYHKGLVEIYFSHDVWWWVSIKSPDFSMLAPQPYEILLKLTDSDIRRNCCGCA